MDHRKYVDRYLKKVKGEVKAPNKSLILDFVAQERAEKRSEARILEYLRSIYRMEKMLGMPFRKARRRDIVNIINELSEVDTKIRAWGKDKSGKPRFHKIKGKLSDSYLLGHKITLKKFYKWLNGGQKYPECVDWIICTEKKLPGLREEDILTPEEVASMINGARNIRDRALIGITYETGARSGEIWELQRKDVRFTPEGAVIHVTNEKYNKGEKRPVPVVYCVRDLMSYMQSMRDKNPNAHLWVGLKGSKAKGRIDKSSFNGIFKRAARMAGIRKKVWVHGLRHVRVSHVKDKLTESVQRQIFGWSSRSEMPGYYGRLSKEQAVNSVFSKVYGIENGNGDKSSACPRCQALMPYQTERCWRCDQPLSQRRIAEQINLRKELEGLRDFKKNMDRMVEETVERKIRERGLVRA